jgi:hypothetical protein
MTSLVVASTGARLLGLLHASSYALLEGSLPGLFMPPQEEATRQACSTADGRAQSGIAGERADNCPTGGSSGPARERLGVDRLELRDGGSLLRIAQLRPAANQVGELSRGHARVHAAIRHPHRILRNGNYKAASQ